MTTQSEAADGRELVLRRRMAAPRAALWRCWTEPDLLCRWFTPPPWKTVSAQIDVRPGGSSLVVMQGPDGEQHPNPGVYLDVVPGERLVFTDAFTSAWQPSGKAFMVAEVTFADAPDGATDYVAIARHWSAEDRAAHEQMGFHEGWGIAADQLERLAREIAGGAAS